jgi:hypothetical protein
VGRTDRCGHTPFNCTTAMAETKTKHYANKDEGKRERYFSAQTVYDSAKNAVLAIPISSVVFDHAVSALNFVTKAINDCTNADMVVVDRENAHQLTEKLDGLISDHLIAVDDGLDICRVKLATSLRYLMDSIRSQVRLLQEGKVPNVAARGIGSTWGFVTGLLQGAASQLQNSCPETYGKLNTIAVNVCTNLEVRTLGLVNNMKERSEALAGSSRATIEHVYERITSTSAYVLKAAHPYVHSAVQHGTPLIHPYVEHVKPFLDPLVHRAHAVKQTLEDNRLVGPYVVSACENAARAMQEVQVYCLAEDLSGADQAIQSASAGLGAVGALPLMVVPAVADRAAVTLDRVAKGRAAEVMVAEPVAAVAQAAVTARDAAAGAAAGVAQSKAAAAALKGAAVVRDAVAGTVAGVAETKPVAAALKGAGVLRDAAAGAGAGTGEALGIAK